MCSAKNVHDRPGQWVFVLCALLSGLSVQKGGSYFAACCLSLSTYIHTPLGHFYYILPIRTWAQILTDWTSFYDPLDYTNINQIISDQSLKKNEFWVPMCTHFTTQ